jgi:hypothetical protein
MKMEKLGALDFASFRKIIDYIDDKNIYNYLTDDTGDYFGYNENSGNVYAVFNSGDTVYCGFNGDVQFMKYSDKTGEKEITEKAFIKRLKQ